MDIPYTEPDIVGNMLYGSVYYGETFLDYGRDGLHLVDDFIATRNRRKKGAVDTFLGAVRSTEI